MFTLMKNPAVRALALCLAVMLLFAPAFHQAEAGSNPIVSLIVGVAFGLVGLVVYDLVSCDINVLFGGCGGGGGNGSGNNGSGNGGNGSGNGNNNGSNNGSGSGGNGGGSLPVACSTSPITNACGMPGTGFITNGSCNASVPPNSACPVPVIGEAGFYAEPVRVRSGQTTTLHWDAEDATVCRILGTGLNLVDLGITGSVETEEITAATEFTLTCWNGIGGPETSQQEVVTIVPSFQEI